MLCKFSLHPIYSPVLASRLSFVLGVFPYPFLVSKIVLSNYPECGLRLPGESPTGRWSPTPLRTQLSKFSLWTCPPQLSKPIPLRSPPHPHASALPPLSLSRFNSGLTTETGQRLHCVYQYFYWVSNSSAFLFFHNFIWCGFPGLVAFQLVVQGTAHRLMWNVTGHAGVTSIAL